MRRACSSASARFETRHVFGRGEQEGYLDAGIREFEIYARSPLIAGRKPSFVYFGGGTPSYLSVAQLTSLTDRMKALLPWDEAEEVTFECEPGTLTEQKLSALRDIGVTRLSLGVENFDAHILEINGRAHRTNEIFRAYAFARSVGFPQINIDLIAGMVEETDENWRENIRKTVELAPDSVTIYQMEVPYDTGIFKEMKAEGKLVAPRRDMGAQARVGGSRVQRTREGGLHDHERLHRSARSGENEVRLSRPTLDGRGPHRPRGGVLLPHRRDPFPEPHGVHPIHGGDRCGESSDLAPWRRRKKSA